jgi:small-conductance mechanosensitive channel
MELGGYKEYFAELWAIFFAFFGGGILYFALRKTFSSKGRWAALLFDRSYLVFWLSVFGLQLLSLPILFWALDCQVNFVAGALFIEGIFSVTALIKSFSKSRGLWVFGHALGWTSFLFYTLGLLGPTIGYLHGVHLKIGATSFTLYGLIKAFIVTAALIWGALFISHYFEKKMKAQRHIKPSLVILFSKVLKTLLIALSVIFGLSMMGIDLTTFSIFAGAIGVGIAFGLQNILSNFFSGFIILIDRSIKPGDVISLNDGKIYGVVNKLHGRYVSVRTREGKEHLIPNQEIILHKLENWSFSDSKIRFEILLRVDFDSDLELVQKLLVEIAESTNRVLQEPAPYVRFSAMIDNAVEVKLRLWIKDPENGTSGIQSDIILAAWKAFKKHGIRVPYPPREIIARTNFPL